MYLYMAPNSCQRTTRPDKAATLFAIVTAEEDLPKGASA